MKIYLCGCGKIGQRLGKRLQQVPHAVVGLKRSVVADFDFPVIAVDLSDAAAVNTLPTDADILVFTVTPSDYSEQGYQRVYDTLLGNVIDWANRHAKPPLLLLVSSTGVYGQQDGSWVDEESETQPTRYSGRWLLHGEQQLQKRLKNTLIVRFSGIYGDGRRRLIDKAISGQAIQQIPPMWTNRIHESDCVGALYFLIEAYQQAAQQGRALDKCYLVSDDYPVGQYDVCAFICEQLGKPVPPVKVDKLSTQCNKRCDNRRIKALGYTLQYPDYRSGYPAVIQ